MIRVIKNGTLLEKPWAELPVVQGGVNGLTGIALAPDYEDSKHVFVSGVFSNMGESHTSQLYSKYSRKLRGMFNHDSKFGVDGRVLLLTDKDDVGIDAEEIISGIPVT